MSVNGTVRSYLRISLDTRVSGSIVKQRSRIAADVTAKGGDATAVVEYADEGVSGSKVEFSKRPAGARLLADLQAGDQVIFTRIDRAARSVRDLLNLVERIEAAGASVRIVDNELDTSGPYGRFMLTIFAALAELEAAITAERRTESLASFRAEGRHATGKAPRGFVSVPHPSGRGLTIAIDPDDGPLVREAVLRVLAGESQDTVRRSLGMSKTGFNHLLRNPRLAGMTPHGEGVVMLDGAPRIDSTAQLITLTEWSNLRALVGSGEKAWSKANGLGRALACGVCGDRLYLNKAARKDSYATYRCRKTGHGPRDPGVGISVVNANEYATERFLAWFGYQSEIVVSVVRDDSAKLEAQAAARVRLEELERRMRATSDEADLEPLLRQMNAAHQERMEADRMIVRDSRQEVTTGRTVAVAWDQSDDEARESMICARGRFYVRPGRGPVADRLVWVPVGREDEWSLDAATAWQERNVGMSLGDIGALVRVD